MLTKAYDDGHDGTIGTYNHINNNNEQFATLIRSHILLSELVLTPPGPRDIKWVELY